jgi:hypothetical protein
MIHSQLILTNMGLLQKFKSWRHNHTKDVKRLFPGQKHIIEPAFEIAGVQYYRFNDVFQIPYERGLMALAIYEETRMKCSREYLLKHVEITREILHSTKVDVYKINQLNEQLSERLNLILDTDLLYKLASIVYFDAKENPALYEAEYCHKKIESWKAHKGVADFFLQKPLLELIPYLENVDFDLNTYSVLNKRLNDLHLERLQVLSSKN